MIYVHPISTLIVYKDEGFPTTTKDIKKKSMLEIT